MVGRTTSEPIVEIKNVTFTYLGEKEPAIKDVNLTINSGDFALVLGPSGAGKSTLLNLFNGSIPSIFEGDFQGDVVVDGINTKETHLSQLAKIVGMVFQDPEAQLINVLVKDEVYFGAENLLKPREEILEKAKRAMDLLGISELMDEVIFQLSGGQKQKVALASVLAMEPKIITLDQPTANLDPKTRLEVFKVLRKLNDELGMTVIVVEHNVDDLAGLINKVIVMEDGHVLTVGEPREVFGKSFQSFSKELGLWIPQVSELALHTENMIDFHVFPLTVTDAVDDVETAFRENIVVEERNKKLERRRDDLRSSLSLIEVKNLDYIYQVNGKKALNNINLKVSQGDFLAILGKNGSGKTTLAKVLMKINKVDRGKVFIKGEDINDMSIFELTDTIGYVFQNPDHQFVEDTVFDEIAFSLRARKIDEETIKTKVLEVLKLFHLDHLAKVSPFALSVGQRRLLSVATMLVLDQDVLILDEPTIGQDQTTSNLLMGYLNELNQNGKAIIIISHDMRLISQWVSRVVVIADSHLLFDGSIDGVFDCNEVLEKAFLLPPPLVVLMQQLQKRGLNLPSSILTIEDFKLTFKSKASITEASNVQSR